MLNGGREVRPTSSKTRALHDDLPQGGARQGVMAAVIEGRA